jgi:predicted metalloprotease with PDZ domain
VTLDGPAYKSGLNAGDEIIAINGMRVLKDRFMDFAKFLKIDESYNVMISRLASVQAVTLNVGTTPAKLKGISVLDKEKALKVLNPT